MTPEELINIVETIDEQQMLLDDLVAEVERITGYTPGEIRRLVISLYPVGRKHVYLR